MQINNISNNLTFAAKSNKTHKEPHPVVTLTLDEFINAKDEDLHEIATLQNKQKNKNSTSNFLAACVGVDAVSSFLLKSINTDYLSKVFAIFLIIMGISSILRLKKEK